MRVVDGGWDVVRCMWDDGLMMVKNNGDGFYVGVPMVGSLVGPSIGSFTLLIYTSERLLRWYIHGMQFSIYRSKLPCLLRYLIAPHLKMKIYDMYYDCIFVAVSMYYFYFLAYNCYLLPEIPSSYSLSKLSSVQVSEFNSHCLLAYPSDWHRLFHSNSVLQTVVVQADELEHRSHRELQLSDRFASLY